MSQIDDFLDGKPATPAAPKVSAIDAFLGEDKPKQNKSLASDVLTAVKQGTLQLPGVATGILDIAPGALGIDRPASKAADFLGSMTGFQPGKWAKEANAEYSPETQQAKSAVDQAWDDPNKGAADVAAAYLQNPRTIGLAAAQSIPSMLAGGLVGRGIGMAAGINSAAARAAIGEGSVMAGSTMDQIDASVDPQKAAAASLVVGAGGAAIGAGGAKIASRFGNVDIDSAIAGGVTAPTGKTMSLAKRVPAGILQEGLLEEAPQSALETGAQNWAEGKPLTEGMARNVTEGALAGGLMGGGAAALTRQQQAQGLPDPDAGQAPAQPPAPAAEQPPAPFVNPASLTGNNAAALLGSQGAGLTGAADPLRAVVTPSQAMGIDPNAGAISRVAAEAVDGPASMEMAVRQAERDMAALAAEDNPEAGADPLTAAPDPLIAQVAGYVGEMGTASPQMVAAKFGVTTQRAAELLAQADPTVDDLFPPPQGAANVSNTDAAGALAAGVGGPVGVDAAGSGPDAGLLAPAAGQRTAGTAGTPAPSVQEGDAAPVSGQQLDQTLTPAQQKKLEKNIIEGVTVGIEFGYGIKQIAKGVRAFPDWMTPEQREDAVRRITQRMGLNVPESRGRKEQMEDPDAQGGWTATPTKATPAAPVVNAQPALENKKPKTLKELIALNKSNKQDNTLPSVDMLTGKESKANIRAQQLRDHADAMGVTGDIHALLMEGKDAKAVVRALGDRLGSINWPERDIFVMNVQATLGIPFKKTTANVQDQPQGTAPAAAPVTTEAVQAPQAVGGDGAAQSGAAPAGRAGLEAAGVKSGATGDEQLFKPETGTLGVPRADMPQVPTASHGGLVKHLNAQGIGHETKTVDAGELKPTQAEYSPAKVEAAKTAEGDRAVIVSNDGHIIDGHHQALAAAQDGKPVKAIVLDAPVEQALQAVKDSPSAQQRSTKAVPQPTTEPTNGTQAAQAVETTPQGREEAALLSDSVKPASKYQLPQGRVSDSWLDAKKRGTDHPDYEPTPRQQMLMDEVAKAKDAGAFYANDVKDAVAKALGVDAETRAANTTGVEGGDFGMDVYLAGRALDAKQWTVDGTEDRLAMLGAAKKKAEEAGMAKAVADGFVEPAAAAPEAPKQGLAGARAKKAAEAEAQRAAYFTPGNIVKGYGGHDRVLEYTPVDERGTWSVRVQRVMPKDGKWVDAPNERPRWHSTQPEAKELAAGPVVKAPASDPMGKYDAEARAYGYQVAPDGKISKGDKALSPVVKEVRGRLRVEAPDGKLLFSGATTPEAFGEFLRSFWGAEKTAQTTNDRDTFTLERLNPETDRMEPVTFQRGETVKIAAGQRPYPTGVITGISHAERKFRVDGNEYGHDFGYAYKADFDELARPRQEVDASLNTLEQRLNEGNAIQSEGFIRSAKEVIERNNLGDYAKDRIAQLARRAADVSKSVLDKMRAAKAEKEQADAQKRAEDQAKVAEPKPPIEMTMDEWKAVSKDFKGMIDGKRTVMRDGGMRFVTIIPSKAADSKTPTVDAHNAAMAAVREGKATAEQFKASFEAVVASKEAIKAELDTMTKVQLLREGGPFVQMRYANEKKGEVVDAVYRQLVGEYALGETVSYGMGKGAYEAAIRRMVEASDDAKLAAYAVERKAAIEEAKANRAARAAAIENPQTLSDYREAINVKVREGMTRKEAFLTLTPEQRIKYDTLEAEGTREAREARKRALKTQVRAADQTTGGQIIPTKHTKNGYDLFVVQLSDRLSREDYQTVLASAKKLGGWYSAFRGNGAVPGFQFKDKANAEAFLKLAGGDTSAAEEQAAQRRDAFEDDRSQTAVERLRAMADKLEAQAAEVEGRERKTNTARRARFASAALNAAAADKAKAKTMRNIADGIEAGKAKFLDEVRTKSQVDMLTTIVETAKFNELRAKYPSYADHEKRKGEPPTAETADFAEFPGYSAFRSDLATLGRQLLEVDGTKKLGQRLMSVADDVTDAYLEFAKANFRDVSQFGRGDSLADFASKDEAERAIKRSGLTGKAIVLPIKRGQNRVILSPSEAIGRGVWQGDGDKRITLTVDFGNELVEAIGRRGNKANRLTVPWQFQSAYDRRKALARIGIETPSEFRSALREFIDLKEQAVANRTRELELQMVGRKADGLDFFPTSAEVADQMVEAADLSPEMAVLEPSAGMGHLADRIREAGAEPDVIEISPDRRELLEEKGYHLAEVDDFMQMEPRKFFTYGDVFRAPDGTEGIMRGGNSSMGSDRVMLVGEDGRGVGAGFYNRSELVGVRHRGSESGYDRIIMNPPFSNRRDADHVRHAYDLLKPGGRIVAIMGEGVFFGQDKKAQDFRDWLDSVEGTSEKLPSGSFMDPSLPVNTAVNARMVVIDKPVDAPAFSRSNSAKQGITNQAAEQIVGVITSRWANAPEVVVVESVQDPKVPAAMRRADAAQRSQGATGEPEGFWYGGKAYIVSGALNRPVDVVRVLFHEVLGHYGLRGTFGADLKPILAQIATMRKSEVQAKATEYGLDMTVEADRLEAAEEVLAVMAQSNPQAGFVKRAIGAIRAWLRENIPGLENMRLTDNDIVTQFILPARRFVQQGPVARVGDGVLAMSRSAGDVADTPAFRKWFGDSKVVDADGKPLVVYHGTSEDFSEFKGDNFFFAESPSYAQLFSEDGRGSDAPRTIPVYLSMKKPIDLSGLGADRVTAGAVADILESNGVQIDRVGDQGVKEMPWVFLQSPYVRNQIKAAGYDGIIQKEPHWKTRDPMRVYVAFRPEQIKSAIGNNGDFDAGNPDIRFSRSPRELAGIATDQLKMTLTAPGKLSWWSKTVGTMYGLAERHPAFKPVFNAAQSFIDDVSYYATDAADMAPKMLPKLENWRDIAKSPISAEDNKAIEPPINEGTLLWARDESGRPVKVAELEAQAADMTADQKARRLLRNDKINEGVLRMWQGLPQEQYEKLIESRYQSQMLTPGVVWTDAELKAIWKLNDAQIGLYREVRAAIDKSLDNLAKSDLVRFVGKDGVGIKDAIMEAGSVDEAALMARDYFIGLSEAEPDRAEMLLATANGIMDRADKVTRLKEQGYAPLSRFGKYTVDVVTEEGRQYFGLFESMREANQMAARMRGEFGKDAVSQGTLSDESFKLFQGITPETLELFGNMLGLSDTGDTPQDQAFQAYLKLTKNNRSAMKRLIQRKGILGYSQDVGRVLANFVYSNARQTASALHIGDMTDAINAIPQGQGEVKDMAVKLGEYIKNPQEEAQAFRGLLFAQYLGGNISSAIINALQPFQVSFPYLSQFGGVKQAGAEMLRATREYASGKKNFEIDLAQALKNAEDDGTVSPQEVFQLMAQAKGAGSLRSGDGTVRGELLAKGGNAWAKTAMAWGKVFGVAEQFNRRTTFIAAYRIAKAQKMADPAAFAKKAVQETQFIYSKANRPQWARGAIGATIFTFKTYSISYLELLHRMATQGGPEGKRAALLAVAVLLLMGGAGGLPFMEDGEDIADTIAQVMGYNFSSKQAKQELLEELFGEAAAQFIERGISGVAGVPIDVSGRFGMGNLVPGTGAFLQRNSNARDVLEVLGPAGDLARRGQESVAAFLKGDLKQSAYALSPRAIYNMAKGGDMLNTGMYRDDKGFKVIEATTGEGVLKAIGFQPNTVAKVQESNYLMQRQKDYYNATAQSIRAKWARGLFEKDEAMVAEAREAINAWNEKNPDQRMSPNMPAIWKRVREMAKDKDQRIADTAPKAMRQQFREETARVREAL